jgi:hypothetical protein
MIQLMESIPTAYGVAGDPVVASARKSVARPETAWALRKLRRHDIGTSGVQPARVAGRAAPRLARLASALACGGQAGLASKGAGGWVCRLDGARLEALGQALDAGSAAHGWVRERRWRLARVAAVVWGLFRVR